MRGIGQNFEPTQELGIRASAHVLAAKAIAWFEYLSERGEQVPLRTFQLPCNKTSREGGGYCLRALGSA
ncbi:hypothetical protein NXC24_PB00231 (plasmid) [Rhizobium sp. NXC24]|nr:hypothetical protein NXC24_PB00231 [Rhizobium sp. NXC24]